MRFLQQAIRLTHIELKFIKYGMDDFIWKSSWLKPFYLMRFINPYRWLGYCRPPQAVRVRKLFEELGPIFIKFGQLLATRHDLLPEEVVRELARLQDKVPPFKSHIAIKIIEKAYGEKIDHVFSEFDRKPLASASIAQVHGARLKTGEAVVVKVLRPRVRKMIERDVRLLKTLARWLERYSQDAARLAPSDVVCEFERHLVDEQDFVLEAANASQLKRNLSDHHNVVIPQIYWPQTKRNVLVMERIYGIHIMDRHSLEQASIQPREVAQAVVEIFFTQVFRDCFFHGDLHPGNIFIGKNQDGKPVIKLVDFGIMGTLSNYDQRYLADNLLAFFRRDYRRVAELHIESGWVPSKTRVNDFEAAIRGVCEPIFERPLKEISFGKMFLRLLKTARRYEMKIQPQLVLLQKSLVNVEGLGRALDPNIDLLKVAKPILKKWMKTRVGIKALLAQVKERAPYWSERLPEIPELFFQRLKQPVSSKSHENITPNKQGAFLMGASAALLVMALVFSAALLTTQAISWISISAMALAGFACFVWSWRG